MGAGDAGECRASCRCFHVIGKFVEAYLSKHIYPAMFVQPKRRLDFSILDQRDFGGVPPSPLVYWNHQVKEISGKNLRGTTTCGQNIPE
jgi:hypothetical protein